MSRYFLRLYNLYEFNNRAEMVQQQLAHHSTGTDTNRLRAISFRQIKHGDFRAKTTQIKYNISYHIMPQAWKYVSLREAGVS